MGGAIWEWQDQGLWNRRDPNHPILAFGGGFGEVPNDHYFIHKGVVFSDRSPKPHFPEMKHVYQWIGISTEDLAKGTFKIRNKYQFINLDGFIGSWTLNENGIEISHGTVSLPSLSPGSEITATIPYKIEKPKPGAEYFIRLSFALGQDELWAKKGFEVASEQFLLPGTVPAVAADPAKMVSLVMSQDDKGITVKGKGFIVVFDKTSGTFSRLENNGANYLANEGGPRLHLWRAPHRNDDMWAAKDWINAGLDALQWKVVDVKVEKIAPAIVSIVANLSADGKNGFNVTHHAVYTILGDGSIKVSNNVNSNNSKLVVARMGIRLFLDKQLDHFAYFGRGPMENYADRKRGFDVGLYQSSVKEQQTPYEKPMECGNHEDVRWASVLNSMGTGLTVVSDSSLLQVSALPYSDEELDKTEYKIDLPQSKSTVLCVSYRTLGVGTKGCGPKPLDQYLVYAQPTSFTYELRLLKQVK